MLGQSGGKAKTASREHHWNEHDTRTRKVVKKPSLLASMDLSWQRLGDQRGRDRGS